MSPELVQELKEIYREEYGVDLTDREALDEATALLGLFEAVYRPIPLHKAGVYRKLESCYKERNSLDSPPS